MKHLAVILGVVIVMSLSLPVFAVGAIGDLGDGSVSEADESAAQAPGESIGQDQPAETSEVSEPSTSLAGAYAALLEAAMQFMAQAHAF